MNRSFLRRSLFCLALISGVGAVETPENLGGGLRVLAESRRLGARGEVPNALARQAAGVEAEAIAAPDGRLLVQVHFDRGAFPRSGQLPGLSVTAADASYRGGVLEGWAELAQVGALAQAPGVLAVHLASWPRAAVGSVTSQAVAAHRVNLVAQDGTGLTIGVLSNSFAARTAPITTAAQDVLSGDLPGPGNPFGRALPVEVLSDVPASFPEAARTDEGRAMCQLIHDLAPGSRLGYASAFLGEVGFANAIRNLAALPNAPAPRAGFRADIIVDDVLYTSSPMFSDGLVGRAVNEVAAAGVVYFSAAQNQRAANAYFAEFRLVPANDQPTAGTNIDLTGVDPALYAGGFHNFREDGGRDIAQIIRFGSGGSIVLQWDDAYDLSTPVTGEAVPVAPSAGGSIGGGVSQLDFTFPAVAGRQYRIAVTRAAASPEFDPIVTLLDPTGGLVVRQDSGLDETVFFFAAATGVHTLRVTPFENTTGDFLVAVNGTDGTPRITTDYNLLFFDLGTGAFVSALAENNVATNRPIEIGRLPGGFPAGLEVQMVVARRFTPTAPQPARWIRYLSIGGGESGKYGSSRAPATYGQSHARGAISVAAYSVFPPSIPQSFTSPGPATILFDALNRRLARPEVRQKPDLAAYDDCNTTFFSGDSDFDADTFPNFAGTSAAAPHAAAIAALVLQAKGGPGSVTPGQMRRLLQASALPHDLDYHFASGTATTAGGGQVVLQWQADQGRRSEADPNAARLSYSGPGSIRTLSLNLRTANPTGGTAVQTVPGLVFDPRVVGQFSTEVGFPFTLGRLEGLQPADITATFSDQAPAPSQQGFQFYQLNLEFTPGAFLGGRAFSFGVDRDLQRNADVTNTFLLTSDQGNSADLLGQAVRLPDGVVVGTGASFAGTMSDGSTFSGFLSNRLGFGYSPLDGYGLIDAAAAVALPVPPEPTPFDDWQRENGLAGTDGVASDTDADGLPLLLEYALDTDPAAWSSGPLFTSLEREKTLTFRRARAELTYEVEISSDLQSWSLLASNPGAVGEVVSVTIPATSPRTFLRLRVRR